MTELAKAIQYSVCLSSWTVFVTQTCHKAHLDNFNELVKDLDSKRRCNIPTTPNSSTTPEPDLKQRRLSFSGYPRVLTQERFDDCIVVRNYAVLNTQLHVQSFISLSIFVSSYLYRNIFVKLYFLSIIQKSPVFVI